MGKVIITTSHNIMEKLLLITALLASVSCSPSVRRTEDNPNNEYNGYEQAPYSVIQKYEDFESRSYPAASWACTEGVITSSSDSDEMFHKLLAAPVAAAEEAAPAAAEEEEDESSSEM